MGYHYVAEGAPRPFAPAKIDFAKKKAKELQGAIPGVKLSECQQAIAKGLGWPDWFALEQAVKVGTPPSLRDEEVDPEEVRRRKFAQFKALWTGLNLHPTYAEELAARLGLTCSAATASQRETEVGPWGAFQEDPNEVAPGILFGECAKFHCYRLSTERQAAMHPLCRVDHWSGWYMADDYEWRVVLSFPQEFSAKQVEESWDDAVAAEPFIYQLLRGKPLTTGAVVSSDAMRDLELDAQRHAESWFAISAFEDWAFDNAGEGHQLVAFSAVQGRDLSSMLDPCRGPQRGSWSAAPVRWFALKTVDLIRGPHRLQMEVPAFRLSGWSGWSLDPVAEHPVKLQLFSSSEIDFNSCLSFVPLVDRLVVAGDPTPIP